MLCKVCKVFRIIEELILSGSTVIRRAVFVFVLFFFSQRPRNVSYGYNVSEDRDELVPRR